MAEAFDDTPDLLWTNDLGSGKTGSLPLTSEFSDATPPGSASPALRKTPDSSGGLRRSFERYDLAKCNVRARVEHGNGKSDKGGLVRDGSLSGMWINARSPLPFKTQVRVELRLGTGALLEIRGRVVRSVKNGFALQFVTHDEDSGFRSAFLEEARSGDATKRPHVVVHASSDGDIEEFERRADDLRYLGRLWETAQKDIKSEVMHDEFITECLRTKHIEFALERYRELKKLQPEFDFVDRHLEQIGTILSFYTLAKGETKDVDPKRRMKIMLFIFILAVVALSVAVAQDLVKKRLQPTEAEPAPDQPRQNTVPADLRR